MVRITATSSLQAALGGAESLDIEATTIRELFTRLVDRYPELASHLDVGIAVSINGQIFRDNWGEQLPADAEVYLLPRIQGG